MSSFLVPMMQDAEDNDNPSYLNRKRKLNAEQLGLPLPKHNCWVHTGDEKNQVEQTINHVLKDNAEQHGNSIDNMMSDYESANDSNSFVVDSHPCTMASSEAKPQSEITNTWPSSSLASTSSLNCFSESSTQDPRCSSDPSNGKELPHLYYDSLEAYDHKDGMLGYAQQYYKGGNIPLEDDEVDDVLGLNGANSHVYVLSSGRWSVDQDPQPQARKPTIDQEFEQYFSSLMLQ
ncbi:unnamed protein product [Linum tenue]|uniref:Far-red elongated hypocotyl 1 n=1 Tax=Linum tenue TaxID=586396 RepID=A0AAV0PLZ4_9ROSI|nr:unnamed protein product [Linum tenue]